MRLFPWISCATVALLVACSSSNPASSSGGSSGSSGRPDAGGDSGDDPSVDGGADGAQPPNPDVKLTTENYAFGGATRKYLLALPVDYDAAKSYPLVLEFHGNPGSAESMHSYYPFESYSKRAAIIVYPNALGTDWDLFSLGADNPDTTFIQSLVGALKQKYAVTQVYGIGWSGGAFFVNELACRYGGLFRALASHAGGAPSEVEPGNKPTYSKCTGGPMAMFITHGDQDGTVPFGSGDADAFVWASINGCADTRSDTTPAPCLQHNGCPTSSPVVFCPIPGNGHPLWNKAMQASWDFFQSQK